MSHPVGTYLGGIRTIEDLRKRSRVDEDTGCWHWSLSMNTSSPKVWFTLCGERTCMRGRRAALSLLNGERLPKDQVAFGTRDCKSDDCVNPAHARVGDRQKFGKALAKSDRLKGLPTKIIASRKTVQKLRKLSPEMVEEIRGCTVATAVLARKFGVAQNTVHQCRAGNSYKPTGASVFSWRPAA